MKTSTMISWILATAAFLSFVVLPAASDFADPRPTLAQCEVVYADSYDLRAAVVEGELDVFDALQLAPESYRTMIIEAYETALSPKTFSARWLGTCLAGRIKPREVE